MKQVQCVLTSCVTVRARRERLPDVIVDVWTPVAVPETDAEQAALLRGSKFIPLKDAQRLVEQGRGAWQWVLEEEKEPPAAVLSGPIPAGFPYARELAMAGLDDLSEVPTTAAKIAGIRGLLKAEPGKRVSQSMKEAAGQEIIAALNKLIAAGAPKAEEGIEEEGGNTDE